MNESFAVLVASTKNANVFENTSCDFKNLLGRSLELSEYNVSLRSITFYDNFKNLPLWEEIIVEEQAAPLAPFFKNDRTDNHIVFSREIMEIVELTNTYPDISQFVTYVNEVFFQFEMQAHIVLTVVSTQVFKEGQPNPEIVLDYKMAKLVNFDTNGFDIVLPRSLARLFGMTRTTFPLGDHYSHLPITAANFNRFEQGAKFKIEKKKTCVGLRHKTMQSNTLVYLSLYMNYLYALAHLYKSLLLFLYLHLVWTSSQ